MHDIITIYSKSGGMSAPGYIPNNGGRRGVDGIRASVMAGVEEVEEMQAEIRILDLTFGK